MNDISIVNDHYVRFKKVLWHDSESLLARCFNFDINIDTGVIIANLKTTSKRSLYEFIRLSFKSFSESPLEEENRNAFYSEVQEVYEKIEEEIIPTIKSNLPYFDILYKHQLYGITESFYKKHMMFAYEMRTGKTLMAASISRVHKIPRTIIICPNNVKYTWFRQLIGFGFNELYFTLLDSAKSRTIRAFNERFVIVNYEMVGKFEKELTSADVGHFILDECHKIKNKNAQLTKNVSRLISQFPEARISFLSGTPVKNRVDDVFSYMKMIGHELGANYKKFMDEYTIKTVGRFSKVSGAKNLQDLYVKMSNFMIRKTQAECLELPEKVYLSYKYELEDYRGEYNKVIEELSTQKEMAALSGSLHSLNIITARAKIKGICEIAEDIIEEGRKVVIFSGYKVPITLLEEYFGSRCVKIVGGMNAFQRDENTKRFWNDPACEVILANTKAGGEGIDLSCASDIIVCDFPLTPSELHQATNRCSNPNQKGSVAIHYTFCTESIDEYLFDLITEKDIDISNLIDNGKEVIKRDNMTELLISKLLKKDEQSNISDGTDNSVDNGIEQSETTDKPDVRTVKAKVIEPVKTEPAASLNLPSWMDD